MSTALARSRHKNEKNEEMLDILQYLHDKYVPVSRNTSVTGEETVKVLEKLFFGGDQLTEERARNSTDARSDGDNKYERLEGLIPKVEDWHAIRILYQVHESPASQDEITDDRFNYACVRLSLGLLLRNIDDAVKEGDGERILGCWKISMLIFQAQIRTRFSVSASSNTSNPSCPCSPSPCLEQNS